MVRIRQKNWYTTIKNRARWMTACHIFFICNFALQEITKMMVFSC